MPRCIVCDKNFHYCTSCGYYEDSVRGSCVDCWQASGADELYADAERDEDYELTDAAEDEIQRALDAYRQKRCGKG